MVKEKNIPYENMLGDKNPAKRLEVREKISASLKEYYKIHSNPMKERTGKNNPLYGKKHTEEHCKKQSEGLKKYWEKNKEKRIGKNHQFYGKTPKEWMSEEGYENRKKEGLGHIPWNKGLTKETDERVAKYSQSHKEFLRIHPEAHQHLPGPHPRPFFSKELGHMIRSGWEENIGRLLKKSNISYGYETKSFVLEEGKMYTPDFVIGGFIVEVKGWIMTQKGREKRFKEFRKKYPEFIFIMIGAGNEDFCDIHISWKEREKLIEILKNGEGKNPLLR